MKFYEVTIKRTIAYRAQVEVEAVDEVRAALEAKERADSSSGKPFSEVGFDEDIKVREIGGGK